MFEYTPSGKKRRMIMGFMFILDGIVQVVSLGHFKSMFWYRYATKSWVESAKAAGWK